MSAPEEMVMSQQPMPDSGPALRPLEGLQLTSLKDIDENAFGALTNTLKRIQRLTNEAKACVQEIENKPWERHVFTKEETAFRILLKVHLRLRDILCDAAWSSEALHKAEQAYFSMDNVKKLKRDVEKILDRDEGEQHSAKKKFTSPSVC